MSSRLITHVVIAVASILVSMARPAGADPAPAGALIQMTMSSTVGVLLDEIPAGALREQAAANALARPAGFWEARARNHLRLMSYRLVFRSGYYPEPHGKNPKTYGPLPLPPREVWQVTPGIPYRKKIDGHDMIVVDYTFGSYIVTDATSPGKWIPTSAASAARRRRRSACRSIRSCCSNAPATRAWTRRSSRPAACSRKHLLLL